MNQQIENHRILGIDLGTTNTVIAYPDDTGQAKLIAFEDGGFLLPSCGYVGKSPQEHLVGQAAYNMSVMDPERTFRGFKRDVGTDKVYLSEDGLEATPRFLQGMILEECKRAAQRHHNNDQAAEMVVITVPAYFGEPERQSVMNSAKQAGLTVLELINEPTAAALAYGVHKKQGDRCVAVLDLGGGTFDITIMVFQGGEAHVLATGGDPRLGGRDVDNVLLGLSCETFKHEHQLELTPQSHPAEMFNLWEDAKRQKHLLSSRTEVRICSRVDGRSIDLKITRDDLAAMIRPQLERIEEITLKTIEESKVDRQAIQHVLLVGGSTRLTAVRDLAARLFGPDKISGGEISPDFAVAEGAAIRALQCAAEGGTKVVGSGRQALPMPTVKHQDVMSHSLGVAVQRDEASAKRCSVMLPRNTPIPTSVTKRYASVSPTQQGFELKVLQGEEGQALADCLEVGRKEWQLPPRDSSQESIEVTMGYDRSGLVTVEARDLVSGQTVDMRVQFNGHHSNS